MRIQVYAAYGGVITVTVATPRPEAAPSTRFISASIHEDYCASVRALLRQHKHVGETALAYPAAQRLQTYFPTFGGNPLYAIRQLMPAGTPRDIDTDFWLEIMRIRYEFNLVLLPAAHQANEALAAGIERNMEKAFHDLFQANSIPDTFIPGDSGLRNEGDQVVAIQSEIDIVCELGGASALTGVDIPAPS